MEILKQLVGLLAGPLIVSSALSATALVRWIRRRRSTVWLLALAAAVGYLGSTRVVGDSLLWPLERQYPPLAEHRLPAVSYIVVLGSDYTPRDNVPVTAALDHDGLARIVEGIGLARRLGDVKLIVSGGGSSGRSSALGYAQLARELGVSDAALVMVDGPRDTAAEARAIAELIGQAPFALITSASHMPRAVRLMERCGAHPIAVPTGQLVDGSLADWRAWIPDAAGLLRTERAVHEYLGLAALAAGVG
jgi:uncharacterized SAM-binding protein YcdF (DUF218 family)